MTVYGDENWDEELKDEDGTPRCQECGAELQQFGMRMKCADTDCEWGFLLPA